MKHVLIATPSYDGNLDVWYTYSLLQSQLLCLQHDIILHPVFMAYDALVQRARNDLFKIAAEGLNEEQSFDCMIFIDADMEWNPQWIIDLVTTEEDVVGGTARKKTDDNEVYVVKTTNLDLEENGLIKVSGLGTGFVKLSNKAVQALWDIAPEYSNDGREGRMVCNVEIIDGELYSEDTAIFNTLSSLGFEIWLNPKMTCNHIGTKKFQGNFESYRERMLGDS